MKDVVIIGAGGHGKVISEIVLAAHDRFVGFLDKNEKLPNLIGSEYDYVNFLDHEFIIAIGDAHIRKTMVQEMKDVKWYSAIHPSAIISKTVCIGEGTAIMPGVVVNSNATIGNHCIINTTAVVEHNDTIGDYTHVSVGAKLGGNVTIGDNCWIGMNSTIINNIKLCENCIIGAGAVVVADILVPGTYVGIPAKRIK